MAAVISTGSPKLSRKPTSSVRLASDDFKRNSGASETGKVTKSNSPSDQVEGLSDMREMHGRNKSASEPHATNDLDGILARLRINDTRPEIHGRPDRKQGKGPDSLDRIIGSFSEHHKALKRQEMDLREGSSNGGCETSSSSADSEHVSRGESISNRATSKQPSHVISTSTTAFELQQMRQELEKARSIITRQERELNESRNLQHTMDQAMGPASETDFPLIADGRVPQDHLQSAFNAAAQPFTSRRDAQWPIGEDARSESTQTQNRLYRSRQSFDIPSKIPVSVRPASDASSTGLPNYHYPAFGQPANFANPISPLELGFPSTRSGLETSAHVATVDEFPLRSMPPMSQRPVGNRSNGQMRSNLTLSDPLSPVMHAGTNVGHLAAQGPYGFQDRHFPGPLSPLSPEFPSLAAQTLVSPTAISNQTYVTPLEPMNYRRLLDKSVSCDWKYIVDKIVCNNDQQASIFLQQKLKVGTAEQKFEIVESIVNQAYPLMINRFGNFLVQRCFEHGTPDQIISIANAIHGNVISLSMDPFGCHVIQKAFDSIPEEHKSDMVRELLRRIPDTVIHRYACHVWQKLFELRWSGEPPQIMVKVNEALRGMWHEVALGETGSLVVQNIFENCVEEEKRPAIEEVVANIDLISHGQFGNWCIQHLCEHGSPPDKRRVIDHILDNSYNYSIDQFASKVVEKCLKIGGSEFLDRYLTVITTARPDRPRIPLIDIAGDQYGNYLIQWILMNTHQQQREQVAIHIRKHMVSLRGSKFGSRVAMLCGNPAGATRPGPSSTLVNPYGPPGQPARNNAWPRYR